MKLFNKGSSLHSILFNKCPQCHIGHFWTSNNPFTNMFLNDKKQISSCPNCSLKYEIEVGFWYGSMYISYALGVATMLFIWSLTSLFASDIDVLYEILIIVFALIIISPINYYLSRLIWINIFISYKVE